jgi:hypothetical protein
LFFCAVLGGVEDWGDGSLRPQKRGEGAVSGIDAMSSQKAIAGKIR